MPVNEGAWLQFLTTHLPLSFHLITLDRSDKMVLIDYTIHNKKEQKMAESKSTQTRDNRIYYTSLHLLFEGYKSNQ